MVDWVAANISNYTAETQSVVDYIAANAGTTVDDAIKAVASADGVAALTPWFRGYEAFNIAVPGLGTLHFNSLGNSYGGDTFVADGVLDLECAFFGPSVDGKAFVGEYRMHRNKKNNQGFFIKDEPVDMYNDAIKALNYGLYWHFGASDVKHELYKLWEHGAPDIEWRVSYA